MQSNRLVVTLNKEMQIGFERGLNQIYENSNLVNEFVVKPSFLLEPKQSLWVTFKNAASNATVTLKPTLLAERKATVANSEKQEVDNDVAQMQQTVSTGYEYYTLLPKEIMSVPDTWYFSVEICQTPEETVCSEQDVGELIKKLQIKTSDIACFTVYSSLAGEGPDGSAPSDLDILNLYNSTVDVVKVVQETAEEVNASNYAPYIGEDGKWYQYDKELKKYVDTDVSAQGPQGIQGPQGERGLQGEKGEDGTSFRITGTVSDVAELPAADESLLGTAYYVGTEAPRDVYSLVKDEQGAIVWQNQGKLGLQDESGQGVDLYSHSIQFIKSLSSCHMVLSAYLVTTTKERFTAESLAVYLFRKGYLTAAHGIPANGYFVDTTNNREGYIISLGIETINNLVVNYYVDSGTSFYRYQAYFSTNPVYNAVFDAVSKIN